MHHRNNETGKIPERSDRFFTQHNYWYFKTREGMDIGPFVTLTEASKGAEDFMSYMQEADQDLISRITSYVNRARVA